MLHRLTACSRKYSIYDATVEDWSAILKLAFDWRFPEVKKLCVRELEKFEIPPLQKIELYQAYELDKKLLIPSYVAMCMRAEPLSIKEGRQLGLETALLLATARESARGRPSGSPGQLCSSPVTVESEEMISIIRDVFGIIASPPSPSLSPLENTGTASATMIPATNGMNGTTKLTTPKKGATPSLGDATTAVASSFGLSPTSTLSGAKDIAKSPGQSASTSSPTILSGRLNSVFAPMQGTVRPPPLEPPPRAPSPAEETTMLEEASSVALPAPSPAPTPADETPAVLTPVLETLPAEEKQEPEMKLTKKEREKLRKKQRQQEKKKEVVQPPPAGEKSKEGETSGRDPLPTAHSTSTPDVSSSQSQSDDPVLVDLTPAPTTASLQQSHTSREPTAPSDKPKQELASAPATEKKLPHPHEPIDAAGGQLESERKEDGGAVEPGMPAVPASESASTSVPTEAGTAAPTADPTDPQTCADASSNAVVSEAAPPATSAESTAPAEPTETTNADTSATTPVGGSDPVPDSGDKTQSKDDKTDSEGNNVVDADVKDKKADPAIADAPAATEAPTQTPQANGDASTTTTIKADAAPAEPTGDKPDADAAKTQSEGEVPATSSGTDPVVPSATEPSATTTVEPNGSTDPATSAPAESSTLSTNDPSAPVTSGAEPTVSASADPAISSATDPSASSTADPSAANPSASSTADPAASSTAEPPASTPKPSEESTNANAGSNQARSGTPKPNKKNKKTPGNTPG